MGNLILKDYVFTKKLILITLLYCAVVPIVLLVDNDGKYYFLDFLIPLVMITVPVSRLMNMEDNMSGKIFQKTLPFPSKVIVGARYLFTILQLVASLLIVMVMKITIFGFSLTEALDSSYLIYLGFLLYYTCYLMVYFWKGFFASQFCIYGLIGIIIIGKKVVGVQMNKLLQLLANKGAALLIVLILSGIFYIIACKCFEKKSIDR